MKLLKIILLVSFTVLVSCGVAGDPTRPGSSTEISS
jgi:hypothetical protein